MRVGALMVSLVLGFAAAALGGSSVANAQARSLIEFKVVQSGKDLGRYDMGVVRNEGGTFVVGNFYPGAQALTGKKRGTPEHRLYGELDTEGLLGKYKRWLRHGGNQEYWMVFLFKNEIKVRHEDVEGGKGQVSVLGKGTAVVPMDPGMPALAWALLGTQPVEREMACAGTTTGAWGKARVVSKGARDFDDGEGGKVSLAHWKVEGDCGTVDLFLDAAGVPQRVQAGDRQYERFVRK